MAKTTGWRRRVTCYAGDVVPTSSLVSSTVTQLIAAQPHNMGKVAAAWHLAVGGAMARLTRPVREAGGVVYVEARDRGVAEQLDEHRPMIEGRLRGMLGTRGRAFTVVARPA
jgi:hypothetical protein